MKDFKGAAQAIKGIALDIGDPIVNAASGDQVGLGSALGFGQSNFAKDLRSQKGVQAVSGGNTTTTNVDAPITVNVPPGTSPDAVGPVVEREMRKGMDRLAREINRTGQGAVVN